MDYGLFFTQRALDDFAEIIRTIAEDDSEAAFRFGNSILDHVDLLRRFPRMAGTIRKRSHVRKLVHSPVVVYYQLQMMSGSSKYFTFVTDRGSRRVSS